MNKRSTIRGFVSTLLQRNADTQPFSDSDSFLLSGRLHSIDAIELIAFLEEQFGVDFADRPFDQSQIDSVDRVMALVSETCLES
jgi:acyl carrier protein